MPRARCRGHELPERRGMMHDFEQLPITRTRPTIPANTAVIHRADPGVPNGAACGADDAVTSTRAEMVTCETCRVMFRKAGAKK